VGFGGYPSFAPVSAAVSQGLPAIIHEQNAVLGRANRQLAKRASVIAGSFRDVIGLPAAAKSKYVFTGNPVRAIVLKHARAPYRLRDAHGKFRLLVFGGSQGARFFSEFMPTMLSSIAAEVRQNIHVIQQCRQEDLRRTQDDYSAMGLSCELSSFFSNMPELMASAQLVVARSGASTIAELGVIGRPAALVPLPGAIDNDQLRNAESFSKAGAGWVFPQASIDGKSFADFIGRLIHEPDMAKSAATQALTHGHPDAAIKLADVVEQQIAGLVPAH
jgi:UDP-N-acetylglucosamine--N-acetylmuramyl-(pentapeptide) pyrophosphoryl-undecaprenol N-acetylglucosamine transferase